MKLSAKDVHFSYGSTPVLKGVTIEDTAPGKITATIGPNAAGKTTFFKCIAGLLKPEGMIQFDGRDLRDFSREEITRSVSYLPQEGPVNAVLTVFEAVLLARKHTLSWRVSDDDLRSVTQVLEDLDIEELSTRFLNELSGGQKQMVSIAQALVREPEILLMDEPTSSLDLQRQMEVLDLIARVTAERGIVTLLSLHDLNLAARYASHFVVMSQGAVYASGAANEVLTPGMLRDVYGVNATVLASPDGILQVTPLSSVRKRKSRVSTDDWAGTLPLPPSVGRVGPGGKPPAGTGKGRVG